MRVLRRRPVLMTNVTAVLVGFSMFASFLLIPQLAQTPERFGYGFSASVTGAGLLMLPSTMVMLVAGPFAGRLATRVNSRLPLVIGTFFGMLAFIFYALFHGSEWEICVGGALLGIGIGFSFASMANLVVESVPREEVGVATGINTIMRSLGGALGAQLVASLLTGKTIAGSAIPAEAAYTDAFIVAAVAAGLAMVAALAIPHTRRPQPVTAPAPARSHKLTMIAAMRRLLVLLAGLSLLAGCGSSDDSPTAKSPAGKPQLTVSAAASLKNAFTAYGGTFDAATVRSSFAGSDELAAQIRQGVKPDVFASANTKLPDELYEEGLVEKPVVFASNQLVLAVPADSTVRGLDDLAKKGTTIAMGSESVPVGAYTRKVLDGLPAGERSAILGNVRSNEPDVGGRGRQGRPGRGRRRLRLRHRRRGDRGQAARDRPPGGPQAAGGVRCRRGQGRQASRSRRSSSSTACSRERAARRSTPPASSPPTPGT